MSGMPSPSQLAKTIASDFYNGTFDLSHRGLASGISWSLMPEVEAVKQLCDLHASKHAIRIFLTLVSAMDRARDANLLWRSGVNLFQRCPEVFSPNEISMMSIDTLAERLRKSGVSQRHSQDTEAWHKIACRLASGCDSVCRLIDTGTGDAMELQEDLCSRDRAGRSRYPLLRGPKIGPMWIRMMANPGDATITRIECIPVAVDVHVRRATEYLGVSDTMHLELQQAKPVIQEAWHRAVRPANIGGPPRISGTCAALDPALWFFSKFGCSHCERLGYRSQISKACLSCRYPVPRANNGRRPFC